MSGSEWEEGWARLPDEPTVEAGWAHHGLAVLSNGDVVAFHPGESALLRFGAGDGALVAKVPVDALEGHGLTAVVEDGEDRVWLADPGAKRVRRAEPDPEAASDTERHFHVHNGPGRVMQFALDGRVVRELPRPPLAVYDYGGYAPTWVAVDEVRHGGSGDVWVADGYGRSMVHRYSAAGEYVQTLTGAEGAGQFNCPHAIHIDRRRGEPELYVADRSNRRVQVYGLDGQFRRVVGEGALSSPSAFAASGSLLIVAELASRLAVLDADDNVVAYLGEDGDALSRPGWPNAFSEDGRAVAPSFKPGLFNSPHGLAVDRDGRVCVAEWVLGGRHVRLAPLALTAASSGGSASPPEAEVPDGQEG